MRYSSEYENGHRGGRVKYAMLRALFMTVLCFQMTSVSAESSDEYRGAQVYLERCALCHGSKGLGEGPMALLIHDYPDTRLKNSQNSVDSVRRIVEHGSDPETTSALSPPWRDELSVTDIKAVTEFIGVLRNDFNYASKLLSSAEIAPGRFDGRKIFRARCETCHGVSGKGDGRMSRIIRDPSPADLTRSTLSRDDTIAIVSAGGKALGRSDKMPPWGQELLYAELVSVVNYLESIRETQAELSD